MKNKLDKDGFDLSKAKKIDKKRREKLIEAAEVKLGRPLKSEDNLMCKTLLVSNPLEQLFFKGLCCYWVFLEVCEVYKI